MKKTTWKLACNVGNLNNTINSLPTLQISLGIVALFEKIYGGEPIITVFPVIWEDVHYNTVVCVKYVYEVKSVSAPEILSTLGYNF
jgi:hypothetical protein